MNLTEERIWDYIDGLCTLEEQETIKQLIANDPVYNDKYAELIAIEQSMHHLELEEPSMSFTHKVMDEISLQGKPLSASAAIDKRIIYGISALFGLMLLTCLIVTINQVNWSADSFSVPLTYKINYTDLSNKIQLPSNVKTTLMYSFFMFDIIAGLMLLDKFLRKQIA